MAWFVTKAVSGVAFSPIAVVEPNCNREVAGLFVVQMSLVEVLPTTVARLEMTGTIRSAGGGGGAGGGVWVEA